MALLSTVFEVVSLRDGAEVGVAGVATAGVLLSTDDGVEGDTVDAVVVDVVVDTVVLAAGGSCERLQQTRLGAESTSCSCKVNDLTLVSSTPLIGVERSNNDVTALEAMRPPAHNYFELCFEMRQKFFFLFVFYFVCNISRTIFIDFPMPTRLILFTHLIMHMS